MGKWGVYILFAGDWGLYQTFETEQQAETWAKSNLSWPYKIEKM